MGKKKPRRAVQIPAQAKVPRGLSVDQSASQPFNWNLDIVDMEGPFGWHLSEVAALLQMVFPRLKSLETMTWGQIPETGSHAIEVASLCKEAQDRLVQLGLEEYDSVYSIRLQGRPRLFGIKDRAMLRVLWWDPEHAICPAELKHT